MARARLKGIIANSWVVGILSIATFLRLYRINVLTEFLGDQGRTMLVMYDWVRRGIVPLSGPTTLTGQPLGPFFYYLLLPGYLLSQGPVGVAVWVALLGVASVAVLYIAVRRMFGVVPARAVSLLWAVSPLIVGADRDIWEPNLVPLFATLFVYLLYRAHREWSLLVWGMTGVILGILMQLHYPNVIFVGMTGLYFLVSPFLYRRKLIEVLKAGGCVFAGFLITLLPFLWYESSVGFRDITGIASVFVQSGATHVGKRVMVMNVSDYAFRVFSVFLPYMSERITAFLIAAWMVFVAARRSKKNIFITVWLLGGLTGMAAYPGVVHNHYLYFLVPVPFFMTASVLSSLKRKTIQFVGVIVLLICCILQAAKTDIFIPGPHDVDRVSAAVEQIILRANDVPFSLTLVNSLSFSDLHYQYYFHISGHEPAAVTSTAYPLLFLVCDSTSCPQTGDLTSQKSLPVICYDAHCSEFYPTLNLAKDWRFVEEEPLLKNGIPLGHLYEFRRM